MLNRRLQDLVEIRLSRELAFRCCVSSDNYWVPSAASSNRIYQRSFSRGSIVTTLVVCLLVAQLFLRACSLVFLLFSTDVWISYGHKKLHCQIFEVILISGTEGLSVRNGYFLPLSQEQVIKCFIIFLHYTRSQYL